ncbi:MAG: hypothetical protein A2X22_09005 [Bacteroidetes bacterium GWF2_49_14]|nr:MAG: hypothetical protein A2X22_09005 [Bacteroidetes bacterium GWF2_49_14]HBB93428.1 hypothetical protein [Bacteroidales bacterium]
MNVRNFFSAAERLAITNAIAEAEKNTSGEIRVHVEDTFRGEVLDQASFIFKKLKMHETGQRNGVLIYLALKNRQFAIIGDAGINLKVPEGFWDQIKEKMAGEFREGRFADGLVAGITLSGEKLKEHFPYQSNDENELTNEISFGK